VSDSTSISNKMTIFKDGNFLIYWMGGNISFLGDIFGMFAMQLLVMNLTNGDAAAMGMVMAIAGIPRLLFILFGGVIIDRYSPMRVLIIVRYGMALAQAALAAIVFTGKIEIWMLYAFAVITGALGSFLMPATMTIMPAILEPDELPAGNALNGSAHQAIQAVAPAVVGFILALLSGYDIFAGGGMAQDPARELVAYGYAFFINAGTFAISAVMMIWVTVLVDKRAQKDEDILKSIGEGFVVLWRDTSLRAFVIYVSVSQLFSMGAQQVGQPIMAMERFQNLDIMPSAVALGLFGTATGVGAVVGSLFSGFVLTPNARWFGPVMMGLAVFRGITLIGLGLVHGLYPTLLLFAGFGISMGYTSVLFMTWMQLRVDISILGRMMSVFMFAMMGIMPISMALAGWGIDRFGLDNLFLFAGIAMILIAIIGLMNKSIRQLGYTPAQLKELGQDSHNI
jgi:MFS family permease